MGSTDDGYVNIAIATLNFDSEKPASPASEGSSISSRFETYQTSEGAEVSWTGRDLSNEAGWRSYAHGTLFVKSTYHSDRFNSRCEIRNDVEVVKKDHYSYLNGFHLNSAEQAGIYHLIFPPLSRPTRIEYLSDPKHIKAVYPNVVERRAVLTWLYRDYIQIKIRFRCERKLGQPKNITKDHLLKVATRSLANHDWVTKLPKGATVKGDHR